MTTAPELAQVAAGAVFLEAATGLEVLRSGEAAERREVAGLALPYGEDLDRPDFLTGARRQRFAPGAAVVRDNAVLFYGHDHLNAGLPIGKVTASEQLLEGDVTGLRLTSRVSATPKGEEVYTLLKDGVLNRFSVGFYPVASHLEDDGDTLVHDSVDVFEVSVVPDPAYQSATVDTVLARTAPSTAPSSAPAIPLNPEGHPMTATLSAEVDPTTLAQAADVQALAATVDTLDRRIATLGSGLEVNERGPRPPGNSYGEFIQLAAAGAPEVAEFLAYVGGTTADLGEVMKDSWVGERFRLIEAQRTTLDLFSRSPLPASGMGVEYGVEGTDTTQVDKQAAEGDVLPYGKITFDVDRAPLETYGGWGDMSRQEIERSPINVVERFFSSLVNRYAQTTEAKVAAVLAAAGVSLTGGVTNMTTAAGWRTFAIRAARALKATGYPIEGIAVGFDVFESLANMTEASANKPFLDQDNGTISIPGLRGSVFNLPVSPIETGATTGVIKAYNSQAIRTYEAAGAPFRLQDDDITNLTKAFSIYGYMATAVEVPKAIVKPQTA